MIKIVCTDGSAKSKEINALTKCETHGNPYADPKKSVCARRENRSLKSPTTLDTRVGSGNPSKCNRGPERTWRCSQLVRRTRGWSDRVCAHWQRWTGKNVTLSKSRTRVELIPSTSPLPWIDAAAWSIPSPPLPPLWHLTSLPQVKGLFLLKLCARGD